MAEKEGFFEFIKARWKWIAWGLVILIVIIVLALWLGRMDNGLQY